MIVLQDRTRDLIGQTIVDSPHAILFSGPLGAGKLHTARFFSQNILGLESLDGLQDYPYYQEVKPTGSSISIDQIRQIQEFTKLRTPGNADIRRIVIIEDAHLMTIEAQNALLKILEEPPADTIIILTAVNTLGLKDTIYSRVRQIPVLPVSKEMLFEFFDAEDEKAFRLSDGLPGLFHAITTSDDHQLFAAIKTAKDILGTPVYQRLAHVESLSKQKEQLPVFLQACRLIYSTLLYNALQKNDVSKSRQLVECLKSIHYAESVLPRNPNYKLLVTDMLLRI